MAVGYRFGCRRAKDKGKILDAVDAEARGRQRDVIAGGEIGDGVAAFAGGRKVECIFPSPAGEHIFARAAIEQVIPVAAAQRVRPAAAMELIVAGQALENIGAIAAEHAVVEIRAGQIFDRRQKVAGRGAFTLRGR